jgi:alkylation response protein AidB-like acyl-CoA dehydrogenase
MSDDHRYASEAVPAGAGGDELEAFRLRARAFLAGAMPPLAERNPYQLMLEDESGDRARELQRILFDGGFAGLCFPVAYGGQGLSRAHQQVFTAESLTYEMPMMLNIPSLSILAPTLLDFGTEEQKRRHLPRIISGEEVWVQFLSEPSGGSDLAGLVTRATRDGDVFILNGSKIWSSGAHRSDYALCLARTDGHLPKHQGLSCFIVKIHQPGIDVHRIMMANGWNEFCQEFFDDVAIPADDLVGSVNDGWTVVSRLLFHERDAMGGGSPFTSGALRGKGDGEGGRNQLVELVRALGVGDDPRIRQLVAESWANDQVGAQLVDRITAGMRTGVFAGPAGSIPRLYGATNTERRHDIVLEIIGSRAGAWLPDDPATPFMTEYLMRQAGSLGGGSNEMQRNIISERVLGMPREYAADRGKPFDEVRHNPVPGRGAG